ncbi:MAG: YwaF family protein [Clostridia bacterium]|nr:YwaF family protein [Clostridia bacterium]
MSDTSLFGTRHIVFIVVSVLLIAGLYILSRRVSIKNLSKILLGVGLISEIVKIFAYIIMNENKEYLPGVTFDGVLPKTDLPFQLCSIQILFILIVNLVRSEKVKRFIYSFMVPSCMVGGVAAILIATSSSRSNWVIACQYFLYHVAIVVFGLRLLTAKEMKWRIKDYRNALIMLTGVVFFSIYINSMLFDGVSDINFMYVVHPPQKNLPYLHDNDGWLGYILRYLVLVVGVITATYSKAIVSSVIECKRKPKEKLKEEIEEKELIEK